VTRATPSRRVAADATRRELRAWGGPAAMGPVEAVMWRAEADPRLRSTMTSVFMCDRAPDWERLYAWHRWLVAAVPRFRQRVADAALGLGLPSWVDDTRFDLDYHLRRVRLPRPGTERQLLDLAQTLAMTPFDRLRPPWEATLVEGLRGERAALVLKLHHVLSDGLGVVQLLGRAFDHSRRAAPRAPLPAARPARSGAAGSRPAMDDLLSVRHDLAAGIESLYKSVDTWARDPQAVRKALSYASSAGRLLGVKPVAGSPLLRQRSLSWRFDTVEIGLAELKAAARACDASVNDVFLAGLFGGLRRYHAALGAPVTRLPVGFPMSVRGEGDPLGGNRFTAVTYAAPVGEPDPVARVRDIQRFVRATRAEPALDILARLMPLLARLPAATVTGLIGGMTSALDAQISNVAGIAEDVYLGGAHLTHCWPFGPLPGCAMMITLASHNGRCCIGVNSDRAAVTKPGLMAKSLSLGLKEMLRLAKRAPRRPRAAERAAPRAGVRRPAEARTAGARSGTAPGQGMAAPRPDEAGTQPSPKGEPGAAHATDRPVAVAAQRGGLS
jgi:diacylglycerol O-acyltransferase / wax synthase